MSRRAFDEYRDQAVADDYTRNNAQCIRCRAPTDRATLTEYGARCGACFTQYVTGGKPNPPMPTMEQKKAALQGLRALASEPKNPRAWAYALKAREEAGEPLSRVARDTWRAALRIESLGAQE